MRKREVRPRRHRKRPADQLSHYYTSARGMTSRVVSFRMSLSLYERLEQHAESIDKDIGACIREAVGLWVRDRSRVSGLEAGPTSGRDRGPAGDVSPAGAAPDSHESLSPWIGKSRRT